MSHMWHVACNAGPQDPQAQSNISALCLTWPNGAIYHVPVT